MQKRQRLIGWWRRSGRTRYLAAALAVIVAGGLAAAYVGRRVPVEAGAGASFAGASAHGQWVLDQGELLRLATFNIHSGRDAEGQGSLARTSTELSHRWHLVALQEVRGSDPAADRNQARILGELLGMSWLYAPTERRFGEDHFGNGALANIPIKSWRRVPLPRENGRGYRNYLLIEFGWQGRQVACLTTHIDSTGDRDAQLAHVIEAYLALPPPSILMGDLNAMAELPAMKALLATAGVVDAVGQVVTDRPQRIDWIITRGFDVIEAGLRHTGASDHPLVWATLKLSR